ncbi:carboxypeptidase-like regulatory domain-containing protein [Longimicrobium sp.]|uniref:carboxypeptidase-like regulatory domain-containing protein n=1 Tax=Longimicrobium sp. TaxID=2029185 RepID=UPI002C33AE06|nr:carboxypeptidase-like regulatory domain-containing protein [Longimicrobium sp.]HSU15988.1 carboxypeptidase-like regulatory domain-containing protein [Longimicrobium sp.]
MRKIGVGIDWVRVAVVAGALLSLAVPAAAQAGRVLGRVTDAVGNPVARAEVALVSADSGAAPRKATTGETGGFDFAAVPPGRYTLRAAAPGFHPREVRVELDRDARETVIARLRTSRGVPRLATERTGGNPAPRP